MNLNRFNADIYNKTQNNVMLSFDWFKFYVLRMNQSNLTYLEKPLKARLQLS